MTCLHGILAWILSGLAQGWTFALSIVRRPVELGPNEHVQRRFSFRATPWEIEPLASESRVRAELLRMLEWLQTSDDAFGWKRLFLTWLYALAPTLGLKKLPATKGNQKSQILNLKFGFEISVKKL